MSESRPEHPATPIAGSHLRGADVTSSEVERLLGDFRGEMRERYVGLDTSAGRAEPVTPERLTPPDGRFLGLYVDNELVACGGVRLLEPRVAEIKRMYVTPGFADWLMGERFLSPWRMPPAGSAVVACGSIPGRISRRRCSSI